MTDEPQPEEDQTQISIEVEAGIDEDWQQCGLDSPPESAEALLAQIKSETPSIHEFIRDWDLLTFVTVNISVRKQNDKGRWDHTFATWTEP